jgi:hypothetical protein
MACDVFWEEDPLPLHVEDSIERSRRLRRPEVA